METVVITALYKATSMVGTVPITALYKTAAVVGTVVITALYKATSVVGTVVNTSLYKNSKYDQEIPQSQTTDNPMAPREEPLDNHETPGRQIKQSNQLSLPQQDDCNTRMDIK